MRSVRGQNAAYRRAYGETILRSAIAQSRRRQSLVSCFGDDKKTLMRRFEGLFDKSVKKRGAALIVLVALLTATLGGTIAVGTKKTLRQLRRARCSWRTPSRRPMWTRMRRHI